MTYENLRTKGMLAEVLAPTLVERVSSPELVSPEQVYLTRVMIKGEKGSHSTEVFGIVPANYVGKEVELVQSYHQLPAQKLFMQDFYVEGKRVLNQAVVKTV